MDLDRGEECSRLSVTCNHLPLGSRRALHTTLSTLGGATTTTPRMVVLNYDYQPQPQKSNTFSDSPFFYDRTNASGAGAALLEDASNVQVSARAPDPASFFAHPLIPTSTLTRSLHLQPHSNPRVSYYFPKGVGEYHYGERHPMKPARLTLTNRLVLGYGLHDRMDVYTPRAATKDELEMFHDSDYVDFLAR